MGRDLWHIFRGNSRRQQPLQSLLYHLLVWTLARAVEPFLNLAHRDGVGYARPAHLNLDAAGRAGVAVVFTEGASRERNGFIERFGLRFGRVADAVGVGE